MKKHKEKLEVELKYGDKGEPESLPIVPIAAGAGGLVVLIICCCVIKKMRSNSNNEVGS